MIDKKEIAAFSDEIKNINLNSQISRKNYNKEVYIFVSFDLVNSTKLKYQYPKWLNLIKKLIDESKSDWVGLNFWKFNGDELLFYAKVIALNQIANIVHVLYERSEDLNQKLREIILNEGDSNYIEDLIGLKTSIWLACVSNEREAFNSRLDDIENVDFAGVNMDEGFRMSKCAIQNKFIVDPKIVFLLSKFAYEIQNNNILNCSSEEVIFIRDKKHPSRRNLRDKCIIFLNNTDSIEIMDQSVKSIFKTATEGFRIIGYEKCKGVWNGRNYPIIWFSDSWKETIDNIKYDEVYLENTVTEQLIEKMYPLGSDHVEVNLSILEKIYENVSVFRKAIDEILLHSNLKLSTKAQLDIQIDCRTYIYYSVVCIKPDTQGVLSFLRSSYRGHLPNTWDFEMQKNAQRISGAEVVSQIEDKFKNNFGVKIKVVVDEKRNSLRPFDIHPIYRRGKLHTGILCFAVIDDNHSEEELVKIIQSNLPNVISGYGYKLYSDVKFLHQNNINDTGCFVIDEHVIPELSYKDALADSNTWNDHQKRRDEKCMTNFAITVQEAINYASKFIEGTNNE